MADLLITGGRLIDPASGLDTPCELLIQDGRIAHIVDAGSAGCSTVPGLRKFIEESSTCRLLAFLHIASHGLASAGCAGLRDGGECDSLNQLDVDQCVAAIRDNPDFLVGVKLRLSTSISDNGRNEQEAYRRALSAARASNVPLMVHHGLSSVPTVTCSGVLSCPGDLLAGDIYTHAFHGHDGGIVDKSTGCVLPDVWEAKRRGVLFDIGHGAGSFSWATAEACSREGFWPDIISTDLHTESMDGPAYDLPTVMTKLLHVGMPLRDVIAAVTSKPAAAIRRSDVLGSLQVGREADITILRLEDCDLELEDSFGETRRIQKRIVPVRVFRAGKEFPITDHSPWPNPASKERCLKKVQQYESYIQK
ncbi:hypothetical protein BaRGS_00027385 [Batillaria attramentaria]|uniref:Amidohydrolase-related domain-containing protein n=1 Tax=Batillaria attramentaria TaxID=370345 RepID=A0ABD0K2H7_9CAEN